MMVPSKLLLAVCFTAAVALFGTPTLAISTAQEVSDNEAYLLSYAENLMEYRQNPIAREFISLVNLVDVVPTWLTDLFIPLFIPGSSITIPVNAVIPLDIPVGPVTIDLPANITVVNVTLNDLNEFKELMVLKLLDGGKYTWGSDIALKETVVTTNLKLLVLGYEIDVMVDFALSNPSMDLNLLWAFDRTKICDVWGNVMGSSKECAIWPMFEDGDNGVSGLNVTHLQLGMSDFDFEMSVTGLGDLGAIIQKELEDLLNGNKDKIIANFPTKISSAIRSFLNAMLVKSIPETHRKTPCQIKSISPAINLDYVLNASRVCFSNNGGFDLKWMYNNCPAHVNSAESKGYPVDQSYCMEVKDALPGAQEGDVLRVTAQAVAGVWHLPDPAVRYVPNSNEVAFECTGTTLSYHCDYVSVAPVDPSAPPAVSKICIINHAGFVMNFDAQDLESGAWHGKTGNYPINQSACITLGGTEGHHFLPHIQAILGKNNAADRVVEYRNNGITATYECRGTTLDYSCKLL